MMSKNEGFSGRYYRNAFEAGGESEVSGFSGRIDTDITASEDSSAPMRKCINLNAGKRDTFDVPMQVLPFSKLSSSERIDLIHRLRFELDRTRILQKKVESQRANGVTVSSSSDILSCSNGQNGPQAENFRKSSVMTYGPGKKMNPTTNKGHGWKRGTSGRFESAKHTSAVNTANIMLMKQCDTLLKRLMSHQYGWVFKDPVDVVKLKIPDYLTVIKHPMDLGTVKSKLASGAYSSPLEFLADVRLTFTNAMTYNPPGNDVHVMADTLSKFFEVRWKPIEKKLPVTNVQPLPAKSGPREDVGTAKTMPPASKKRKITSMDHNVVPEPVKQIMTNEEKHNLGRELESLLAEMPVHIIDFLREQSLNGKESGEDTIEIDIDDLCDDTLFTLRKLLDGYLLEKQKNLARGEPCETEVLNESGLSNSSMQQGKGNDLADEDIDIGGNEPPVSSYPPVEIEKDTDHKSSKCMSSDSSSDSDSSSSSESEAEDAKDSIPGHASKVSGTLRPGARIDEKTTDGDFLDRNRMHYLCQNKLFVFFFIILNVHASSIISVIAIDIKPNSCNQVTIGLLMFWTESVSGLDQLEQTSQQKPSSVESEYRQDGDSAPNERQVTPDKQYRAALLKNRFADTILKAREKTLAQVDKGDPEKLRRDREALELQKKKEKARLQAEAKAAEDARRRADAEAAAEAAAEARRRRELEREAARQALLRMEKTVEINENSRFLEDLEMLSTAIAEQLHSSADETSPDHFQDRLGSFKFGGTNPLEQLGLYMKDDEEEEEAEPPTVSIPNPIQNPVDDVEEGEID
ncbi:Bromodomain domain-containing protein [Cephalotus follicularis]|uniref:Bromodomain domain-containing protein n=1 Tax=Cephalotus follicularis TaxID=3775 RepID=A0A1Q3CZY1_CEPFO|nr:Bromodomain domain-containing protein [Cephalotus follicularis]